MLINFLHSIYGVSGVKCITDHPESVLQTILTLAGLPAHQTRFLHALLSVWLAIPGRLNATNFSRYSGWCVFLRHPATNGSSVASVHQARSPRFRPTGFGLSTGRI